MSGRLTRRSLLRRGSAGAAGATFLGAAALRPAVAAAQEPDPPHNALLIVLPMLRADFVGAYDGKSRANTPNIDRLAGNSLRFEHAVAESGPAWPVRRALLTGMRSFPFRNWRRTEGMPAVPGFNPIYAYQPVVPETMRQAGINVAWVTDNPLLTGPRFEGVQAAGALAKACRACGAVTGCDCPELQKRPQAPAGIDSDFVPSLDRARDAAVRTLRAGTKALDDLAKDQPFFLAVDAFDPQDAFESPRVYVRQEAVDRLGLKDMRDSLVPTRFGDDVADDLGKRWGKAVEAMDDGVGKLLDRVGDLGLADNTLVVLIGDHGVALGEHGYIGKAAPTSHRLSHEVAFMIRHPNGKMKGEESSWYASTHDVPTTIMSYLGVTAPGKADGEDLTQLFDDVDDEDLPKRPAFTSVSGPMMISGDKRFLVVVDRDAQERWLYDDDEEDDHTRYENAAGDNPDDLQRLSEALGFAAGGTLPEWGPDGTQRPLPEQSDDDVDGDGIRNDDDPINDDDEGDDDYKDDDTRAGAFDGGDPTGKIGNFLGGGTSQPPTGQRGRYFSGDTPIP